MSSPRPLSLPPIVLASQSPRRAEILTSLGLQFTVSPSDFDEESLSPEDFLPEQLVTTLAREKAKTVATQYPDCAVIGADTVVVLQNGQVLGKPRDVDDANRMLGLLSGNTHQVYTGIAVVCPEHNQIQPEQSQIQSDALMSQVTMRPLTPEEIEAYVQTREPMDKAGAYAIQGLGSVFIQRVEGCFFNVMGFSPYLFDRLLTQAGYSLFA